FNLTRAFGNLSKKSAEYIENINLLEVAYANIDKKTGQFNEDIEVTSARIEKLVNNMAQVYGLDESRLARQFGIFKQMANAMDLPTETAEKLSEHLVKMSNDVASLYNLDLDRASNALQSALAGQVRPIRTATGADITEKTLQQTVNQLGLDRTINQLSYVEKRLIMIISLTDQLKKSQGDWARTMNDSVANQLKILDEQWNKLTRSVGNMFIPVLQKVLPYLTAILMVLTELFNMVAGLLGFKMPEFDYSGLAGVSDATNDVIDGMNEAGASVDELNKKLLGLRGFDKLNVISSKTSDANGAGSGLDPRILQAFNKAFAEYNDMMAEVSLKANEIKKSIMEWLGFEEEFDEEGNSSWLFKKITPGTVIGALVVGGSLVTGVSSILSIFKKIGATDFFKTLFKSKTMNVLLTIGGFSFSFDAVKKELDGDTTWATIFEGLGGTAMVAAGVWNLTHDIKITLIATAITIVPQALAVTKKGWDELLKNVDYYANNDGKTTFTEYVDAWLGGMQDIITYRLPKFFANIGDKLGSLWNGLWDKFGDLLEWMGLKQPNVTVETHKASSEISHTGEGRHLDPVNFGDIAQSVQKGIEAGADKAISDAQNKGEEYAKNFKKGVEKEKPTIEFKGKMSTLKDNVITALKKMTGVSSAVMKMFGIDNIVIKALENIKFYAKGGLPDVGQIFIANEKGPELVGQIGGQSFVANQNQMMNLLDKKIGNAQKNTTPQVINVYLDADHKIGSYTIEQLQNMAKTDGKPITIG
ncbi:MAG: hypothetical protein J6T74_00005, partial [Clostridia bacterium]|nr:hypothetical protein [Clostridia bacterium]